MPCKNKTNRLSSLSLENSFELGKQIWSKNSTFPFIPPFHEFFTCYCFKCRLLVVIFNIFSWMICTWVVRASPFEPTHEKTTHMKNDTKTSPYGMKSKLLPLSVSLMYSSQLIFFGVWKNIIPLQTCFLFFFYHIVQSFTLLFRLMLLTDIR